MKSFSSNKVLVTGGAGFIGSHTVDKLIELGYDVVVIDDLSTGLIENIHPRAEFHKIDLGEVSVKILAEMIKNIKYIFHLAAIPRIMYCIENPKECHKANVEGTINLLEACRRNNNLEKFILASTCCVYGDPLKLPINEEEPIKPTTPYAAQKYMQEMYARIYSKLYGIPSVILRYFTVYGTKRQSEKGSYPNVLAYFSRQKREENRVYVTGDGKQTRDFIHVFDVVKANIKAMKSNFKNGEAFNIGTGVPIEINKVAEYFKCKIVHISERPAETKHIYADTKKAEKLLNWKYKIPFEEGIKNYLGL